MQVHDIFWNVVKKCEGEPHVKKSIEVGNNNNAKLWKDFVNDHYESLMSNFQIIKECYTEYQPENVFLSFNGGKDCTVLLYLTMYVLKNHFNYKGKLVCLYIRYPNPFPELEAFINECETLFNLDIVIHTGVVRAGLEKLLKERNNMQACLMGTRRTDPYSEHLQYFQLTDPDWPQVMRVSPVLDWTYSKIWEFLLVTKASYCKLYNDGYTSLGDKSTTVRNPALKYVDSQTGDEKYLPAWNLQDESQERCGRSRL